MSLFFPITITAIRKVGMLVEGVWSSVGFLLDTDSEVINNTDGEALIAEQNASGDTFYIRGSVQPITGKDMDSLPIGRSDIGRVKLYTSTKLEVGVTGSDNTGDLIQYDGRVWEVIQESTYANGLIAHYKYIAEYREEVA